MYKKWEEKDMATEETEMEIAQGTRCYNTYPYDLTIYRNVGYVGEVHNGHL